MKNINFFAVFIALFLLIGCKKGDTPFTNLTGPLGTPKPGFKYSFVATDTDNFTIQFTDTSKNATSWRWDFGDDSTSNTKNPIHTYKGITPGTFKIVTVRLIVANAAGAISNIIIQTIQVGKHTIPTVSAITIVSGPTYHFIADGGHFNNYGTDMKFTATTDKAQSILWDFGDNATSTDPSPTHTYLKSGQYTVSLKATSISGDVAISTKNIGQINVYDGITIGKVFLYGTATRADHIYILSITTPPVYTFLLAASDNISNTGTDPNWQWEFNASNTITKDKPIPTSAFPLDLIPRSNFSSLQFTINQSIGGGMFPQKLLYTIPIEDIYNNAIVSSPNALDQLLSDQYVSIGSSAAGLPAGRTNYYTQLDVKLHAR